MISIIVPVYNAGKYLEKCLDSICGQTYKEIEVILVNDGSRDGSMEICEAYVQKDPRVKLLSKRNEGVVKARKDGLKIASGEYVGYVDADDWIEPDMYGRLYAKMTEQDVDVVMCAQSEDTGAVHKEVRHGPREGRYGKREMLRDIYPEMIAKEPFFEWGILPGLYAKLFRRERLERFQFAVDERLTMGEDAACTYPCLLHAESIYVMRECLYHYRQTALSMVKEIPEQNAERERFRTLYQTVNKSFEESADIFDLRQQWKAYMLFIMTARADGLYRGYEELDYLFPFPEVKKGMEIILYGAGTYGQRLYKFLEKTGFCHVAAWVDQNYVQLKEMGLPVEAPAVIPDHPYDAIVVANTYSRSKRQLYGELVKQYPEEKVHLLDEKLVFSEESLRAFGLAGIYGR